MYSRLVARHGKYAVFLLLVSLGMATPVQAAEPVRHEPRVALLELYTSEGCNSCPPVDRQVSALAHPALVPGQLVILAFHVDYWNYLGWVDRFSQKQFSERQQYLVRANRLRTAYTPQLILNGHDYRGLSSIGAQARRINATLADINLKLKTNSSASGLHVVATAKAVKDFTTNDALALYVAVYENNLESRVNAGENRGEVLHHDFVVRQLIGPVALDRHATGQWSGQIPLQEGWKRSDLGVAAFVQSTVSGEVHQATARSIN